MISRNESTRSLIVVITGNMAAGKSTVAQALAERLPKSVHLRGDWFRRVIVNGRAEMDFILSGDAKMQLGLRYELAVHAAKRYAENGFVVIYQDVILGETLGQLEAMFYPFKPAIIVLCPRADVVEVRERSREKSGYQGRTTLDAFDTVLRDQTPHIGYWLDTSELTVAESVEDIVTYLNYNHLP